MRWLLALALVCSSAFAQTYPARPVRIVVPFPPASTPDIVGRTLATRLQDAFGQPVIVENRTGAGGNIGTEMVAKAPADGYTLLIGTNGPIATNKYLYQNVPYDAEKDLAPISLLASAPQMLVVVPQLDLHDFGAFIDYARKNPGRISYGSVGSGSASHLTMELLKSEAKFFAVHIPYRGFPPAVTDMLAGNIQAMFAIVPGVLSHVRAGKMTALAITALERNALHQMSRASPSSATRSLSRWPGSVCLHLPAHPRRYSDGSAMRQCAACAHRTWSIFWVSRDLVL